MQPFPSSIRSARVSAFAGAFLWICWVFFVAARADEPSSDFVGVIDGDAVSASGPINVEVVRGLKKTMLRSGSEVRVTSGTARIDLVEGGQISICGPAHFSVLKFNGALTVALDSGTIHVHVERAPVITIYTAQIQAKPVAIGDGPQDVLVGFDATGAMCVRANRGAARIEQQLTGQSVLVPQTGDVLVENGQLDNLRTSSGRCACELDEEKPAPPPQPEISVLASAEEVKKETASKSAPAKAEATAEVTPERAVEKPATKEEPVYQVLMPPLVYEANAKVQPEIDPRTIVLVRRVRVRSTLVFRGRVEGEALSTAATPSAAPAPVAAPAAKPAATQKPTAPANNSFFSRVLAFFRRLWS